VEESKRSILFAAGGTGGHVYPAIAIADAIRALRPGYTIHFVGTKEKMEWTTVPKAGYEISSIWISGFHRKITLRNLLFPIKLITSLIQSASIIKKRKPDALVACGGFVAGPVGYVAAKKSIPLYLQEQNSFPGVTNRLLSKFAQRIFTAFPQAEQYFEQADKIELSGNPVRSTLMNLNTEHAKKVWDFTNDKPVLLILGGSLGAKSINLAMLSHLTNLHDEQGLNIIWQCGKQYEDYLISRIQLEDFPNLRLKPYLENMEDAYAAADLIISRAGASSCSELMVTGKPSVLVPSQNVAGDHQTQNARSMVDEGAAALLPDNQVMDELSNTIEGLIHNQTKLSEMSKKALSLGKPNAAKHIAERIINDIEKN
jgi:UDP-N-acetylglucosamine--N-acetylmuramyl-(pentapeptide) pyrophosphoryl-undecaprenol N-acetylglucosamine transferase